MNSRYGERVSRRLAMTAVTLLAAAAAHAQHGFSGGGGFHGGFVPRVGSGGGSSDAGSAISMIVCPLVLLIFAYLLVQGIRGNQIVGTLEIIDPPPGEAPAEIRQAWVGVQIPLRRVQKRPVTLPAVGTSTGKSVGPIKGYAIPGSVAIAELEKSAPQAAAWWKKHAAHTLVSTYSHVFPADICRVNLTGKTKSAKGE